MSAQDMAAIAMNGKAKAENTKEGNAAYQKHLDQQKAAAEAAAQAEAQAAAEEAATGTNPDDLVRKFTSTPLENLIASTEHSGKSPENNSGITTPHRVSTGPISSPETLQKGALDLQEAIHGAGTDRKLLSKALNSVPPQDIPALLNAYEELTGNHLIKDLSEESGFILFHGKEFDQCINKIVGGYNAAATAAGVSFEMRDKYLSGSRLANFTDSDDGLAAGLKAMDSAMEVSRANHGQDTSVKLQYSKLRFENGQFTSDTSISRNLDITAAQATMSAMSQQMDAVEQTAVDAREQMSLVGKCGEVMANSILNPFHGETYDELMDAIGVDKAKAAELSKCADDLAANPMDKSKQIAFLNSYKNATGRNFDPGIMEQYMDTRAQYYEKTYYDTQSNNINDLIGNINYSIKNGATPEYAMAMAQHKLGLSDEEFAIFKEKAGITDVDSLQNALSNMKSGYESLSNKIGSKESLMRRMDSHIVNMFGGHDMMARVHKFNDRQEYIDVVSNVAFDVMLIIVTDGAAAEFTTLGAGLRGGKMLVRGTELLNNPIVKQTATAVGKSFFQNVSQDMIEAGVGNQDFNMGETMHRTFRDAALDMVHIKGASKLVSKAYRVSSNTLTTASDNYFDNIINLMADNVEDVYPILSDNSYEDAPAEIVKFMKEKHNVNITEQDVSAYLSVLRSGMTKA